MAAMAKECHRVDAKEILWRVHAANREARSFYARLGAGEWRLGTTMWVAADALTKAARR